MLFFFSSILILIRGGSRKRKKKQVVWLTHSKSNLSTLSLLRSRPLLGVLPNLKRETSPQRTCSSFRVLKCFRSKWPIWLRELRSVPLPGDETWHRRSSRQLGEPWGLLPLKHTSTGVFPPQLSAAGSLCVCKVQQDTFWSYSHSNCVRGLTLRCCHSWLSKRVMISGGPFITTPMSSH